jgi:alkanesulfonate monooxygenase SsuD/methylene tetrahydromethanopterin reductase-like flavin-dependent oxidoreductase (luciferase family)
MLFMEQAYRQGFSKANNGAMVDKVLAGLPSVVAKAIERGYRVRGYVSVVMTDPYTGAVTPEEVIKVVRSLDEMGCYEISLGDTTGEGDPERWQTLWKALQKEGFDMDKFAAHVSLLSRVGLTGSVTTHSRRPYPPYSPCFLLDCGRSTPQSRDLAAVLTLRELPEMSQPKM